MLSAATVFAGPGKVFEGNSAGNSNSTFVDFVGNNFPENDISGWVKYSEEGTMLTTRWQVRGLEPNTWYQLKLESKETNTDVADACGSPNSGPIWQCGTWSTGDTFLVMETVLSNDAGIITYSVEEGRLPLGYYKDVQFMVTENYSTWESAWTWENSPETDTPGDSWDGDISSFTIN